MISVYSLFAIFLKFFIAVVAILTGGIAVMLIWSAIGDWFIVSISEITDNLVRHTSMCFDSMFHRR